MSHTFISHPLALNTKVKAVVTGCACRGSRMEPTEGKILKVITSNGTYWYYLDNGRTVKADQIQMIV